MISLVDLDNSGFPNLALMKLSAYFKAQGQEVSLNFPLGADEIYASCVFSWNKGKIAQLPEGAIIGGSAISMERLTDEIEHIKPDYSLYNTDFSMGFTSRGCPRQCTWCIVPGKEGHIVPWANIYEFWNPKHKKLRLLDNNLLAAPNWKTTLQDLIREQIRVDFNQALDIRLVNEETAHYLTQCKYDTFLRFSFDELSYEPYIHHGLTALQRYNFPLTKVMIYILVGFDSTLEQDLDRVSICRNYHASPFIMKYSPFNAVSPQIPRDTDELKELARWVNQPHGFYKVFSFAEWQKLRAQKMMRRLKGG